MVAVSKRMLKNGLTVLEIEMFIKGIDCYKCRLLSTTVEKKKPVKPKYVRYNLRKEKTEEVADLILKHRKYKDSIVVENNPGDGLLTKALFKKGRNQIKSYCCCEVRSMYSEKLKKIQKKFGTDVVDLQMGKNTEHDDKQIEYLETMCSDKDITSVTYIRSLPSEQNCGSYSIYDFNHILENLQLNSIFDRIMPEYFYFFSPKEYRAIFNLRSETIKPILYKQKPVFLHHFFHIEYIAEIPHSDFVPVIPTQKNAFRETDFPVHKDCRYLLHMLPQLDRIREIDNLKYLKYFFKQLLISPKERLIPKLESMLPGCGIHLIRKGVTMMNQVRDMEPQFLIQIYKEMKTYPGYENSFLRNMFSKLDESKNIDSSVELKNQNNKLEETWEDEAGDLEVGHDEEEGPD